MQASEEDTLQPKLVAALHGNDSENNEAGGASRRYEARKRLIARMKKFIPRETHTKWHRCRMRNL